MSDPYSNLATEDPAIQARIADAMEARCLEPAQQTIRAAYLGDLTLPDGACAVELGSGTGHVTRDLVEVAGAERALGIEPSPVMIERARKSFAGDDGLSFEPGDAKATGLPDGSADLVLMHTLLCHVPGPGDVLREAFRILKPGVCVAICDGDYDTSTASVGDFDPLDQIVRFMIDQNVTNLCIMRQVAGLLARSGFELGARRSHG